MRNRIASNGNTATLRAADWICLAAMPTFAIMGLVTGILGSGMPDGLCAATGHSFPLDGMVPMYLLMGAFHSTPWLKLLVHGDYRCP
jgi:hypothetical protein